MESCLLCLDTENNMLGYILVNSMQWQKENVKYLIEKHLWPLNGIKASEKICISCWNELKTFHEFYVRIKEAHAMFNTIEITKKVKECTQKTEINSVPQMSNVCNEEIVDIKLEAEISAEQSYSAEFILETENPMCKDHYEATIPEVIPIKRSRRKRRPIKNMVEKLINEQTVKFNPLTKTKKYKVTLIGTTLKTKETNQNKKEGESVTTKNSNIGTLGSNENCDSANDEHNEQQSVEICKKKRKNPDEKTRLEYDKIIAEYFKIFCSVCQIPIENFVALRKHFREEHNKRGFVICCKKKIFTRPILVDHIQFHLDPNFFKCNHCNKIYSDRSTLDSHIKIHEDSQQGRNHVCNACGKSFVGSAQLESHKLTHAPDYEKKFSCKECGKFFTTLYSLNYHIQGIHHNKYVKICDICGKTIRCRNSFKLHMEKHDNKLATPIHCDICGLRLIDRRGLRRHKNSQHPIGGKKEYSCHICSKISPNLRALRTHVRFAHEIGYAHKCTMCDKAFKRPEALREHMATHTGTPLYNCPWCTKTFISNGNMHNHRKKAHPKEWEEAQRQKYGGIFLSNS